MDRRSVLIGSIGGVGVTALVLFALPHLMRSAARTRLFFDFPAHRWVALWLALLGAVLGLAIIVSRRFPLVVAVPAVLLGIGYYVIGFGWFAHWPRWAPEPIAYRFLWSLGPAALTVVGVFATVAVWRLRRISRGEPSAAAAAPAGRTHLVVGAIGGVAVGVALALLLKPLWYSIQTHSGFREWPGLWRAILGFFALGSALGAVMIVSERVRALAASAALASLVLVGLNPVFGLVPFDWVASSLLQETTVLPHDTVVIVGMLVAVGAWQLLAVRRPAARERAKPGGEPAPPVYAG